MALSSTPKGTQDVDSLMSAFATDIETRGTSAKGAHETLAETDELLAAGISNVRVDLFELNEWNAETVDQVA